MITKRLSSILLEHKILHGRNYCGLKEESTSTPLCTLNNIIEDAKEHKKELWILTQDMAKAYDSVSMEGLLLSLRRLGLPERFIQWILDLFQGRHMRVITAFGLTDPFSAADGIDQGDSISPLIWRIFYDLLLVALQQDRNRGYHMSVEWPLDIQQPNGWKTLEATIPALAFMDDTCLMDRSRMRLQDTVDLANQLYHIHDIFINGDKCELVVINPMTPKTQRNVCIGQARTIVQATSKEVRYLGVWVANKQPRKLWIHRLKAIIKGFLDVCGKKHLGIGHLAYLINRVLIPKLLYMAQLMTLKEREWDIIFRPVLGMVKRQIQVARSTPTAAILHEGLTGIDSVWHQAAAQTVALFTTITNEDTVTSITSLIRLRQAQLNHLLTTPIWELERDDLPLFYNHSQNNLSLHALIVACSLNISFNFDQYIRDEWCIRGGLIPLRELLIESGQLNRFKKFLFFKNFP